LDWITLITAVAISLLLNKFLPAYLSEKGNYTPNYTSGITSPLFLIPRNQHVRNFPTPAEPKKSE